MQPFSFQDALIGAVLMLAAAYGWITFVQAHYTDALATTGSTARDPGYLQYWPLLVHILSLVHLNSMH